MASSLSLIRRILDGLARAGLDLWPLAQRARAAILRPVRAELAGESAALRAEVARLGETATEMAALRAEVTQLGEMAAELGPLRVQVTQLGETAVEVAALRAQVTQLGETAAEVAALRAQVTQLGETATEVAALRAEVARLGEATGELAETSVRAQHSLDAQVDAGMADIRSRAREDISGLQWRLLLHEHLITGQQAWHPPATATEKTRAATPAVSIILPTRDRAHSIGDAIASVREQRFTDWELIIVDDGSCDETVAVVAPFLDDARIRFVQQAPIGMAAARNHGHRLSRGALIGYIDSDNIWYPDFLAAAVAAFAIDPGVTIIYGALVSNEHDLAGTHILYKTFDRDALLQHNFIDVNTIVHRRECIAKFGGFDETLDRLTDWDLVLRYTADTPATPVPVLAARYRVRDDKRVTTTAPLGPNSFKIRRKWQQLPKPPRQPRVLYLLWQHPQLSETYVETEIRCMRGFGADIEVWAESPGASAYPTTVPIHRGTIEEAIAKVRPDLLHVHWLNIAHQHRDAFQRHRLPITVRGHGFEFSPAALQDVLAWPGIRAVYVFPHQAAAFGHADPRVRGIATAFDTNLFRPQESKDRRLVIRTAAGLPSKDLPLIAELAKKMPGHRFVLAAVSCKDPENYIGKLQSIWRQSGTPAELMIDASREELVPLVTQAGLYLHTVNPPGEQHATPIGMPISIAEAMATGAHILVRDLPALTSYAGDAGSAYRDLDHAAEIIARTAAWSDEEWQQAWLRSVDRAFLNHADETVLLPIFQDWCAVVQDQPAASL